MLNTAVASSTLMLPLLLMLLLTQVDAECCLRNPLFVTNRPQSHVPKPSPALIVNVGYGGDLCNDGLRWGSPCCGVGGCNGFCCNCEGGCRKPFFNWHPDFQDGPDNVKWQSDCDLPGYDIGDHDSGPIDCAKLCIKTPDCNAFRYHLGKCYLKNVEVLDKQPAEGGACGFLPWGIRYFSNVTDSGK